LLHLESESAHPSFVARDAAKERLILVWSSRPERSGLEGPAVLPRCRFSRMLFEGEGACVPVWSLLNVRVPL
jgi:hypothetical protein